MKTPTPTTLEALRTDANILIDQLPNLDHGDLIQQSLEVLLQMAQLETERLDWKTVHYALQDMTRGFELFYAHRHTRKITIFGSARTPPTTLTISWPKPLPGRSPNGASWS